LEEALDLSSDRLLDDDDVNVHSTQSHRSKGPQSFAMLFSDTTSIHSNASPQNTTQPKQFLSTVNRRTRLLGYRQYRHVHIFKVRHAGSLLL